MTSASARFATASAVCATASAVCASFSGVGRARGRARRFSLCTMELGADKSGPRTSWAAEACVDAA
eukprot:scaffold36725_cov61-Phaeocystis_antarctica.AAC.2